MNPGATDGANGASKSSADAVSLILSRRDEAPMKSPRFRRWMKADRAAETQFSGEAPTLTSLFGNARAAEFYAGRFNPSPEVARVMADSLEFLIRRKNEGNAT